MPQTSDRNPINTKDDLSNAFKNTIDNIPQPQIDRSTNSTSQASVEAGKSFMANGLANAIDGYVQVQLQALRDEFNAKIEENRSESESKIQELKDQITALQSQVSSLTPT